MSVNVAFPDEVLLAARESRDEFAHRVLAYTLGHLYEQGKISSGFAARILGCSRREFYHLLTRCGFDVIAYDAEDLDEEARTSAESAAARPKRGQSSTPPRRQR